MRPLHATWRHLTSYKVDVNDVKGALIYLSFELAALVLLVAVLGLLAVLISQLF